MPKRRGVVTLMWCLAVGALVGPEELAPSRVERVTTTGRDGRTTETASARSGGPEQSLPSDGSSGAGDGGLEPSDRNTNTTVTRSSTSEPPRSSTPRSSTPSATRPPADPTDLDSQPSDPSATTEPPARPTEPDGVEPDPTTTHTSSPEVGRPGSSTTAAAATTTGPATTINSTTTALTTTTARPSSTTLPPAAGPSTSAPEPGPVRDLRNPARSEGHADLSWRPDPNAVSYVVRRDGAIVGSVETPAFTDVDLDPATDYRYEVAALGASGAATVGNAVLDVRTHHRPFPVTAVGDIANCRGREADVARVAAQRRGDLILLGDLAYPNGSAAEFANCFDPHFGPLRERILPVVGNHEYETPGAAPYFDYFGAAAGDPSEGWYAVDRGTWQIIVLNTNCGQVGNCYRVSPQYEWLEAQLRRRPNACRLVAWHHPRWSSSVNYGDLRYLGKMFSLLHEYRTDLLLAGHVHAYERFAPLNPAGVIEPDRGIRQIIVGTGGVSLQDFDTVRTGSRAQNTDTWGVLELDLAHSSYHWSFRRAAGGSFTDEGSSSCINRQPCGDNPDRPRGEVRVLWRRLLVPRSLSPSATGPLGPSRA